MQLTLELKAKIDSLIENISLTQLVKDSEQLTSQYRNQTSDRIVNALTSDNQRLAYLVARFPATYAVIYKVLKQAQRYAGEEFFESLLDIGSGPGTALLAAIEADLLLKNATMLERDSGFIRLGRQLVSPSVAISQEWICHDLRKDFTVQPHDLVIASYSLNELNEKDRLELLEKLWKLTKKMLIIIEPGTKSAFEALKVMRKNLISQGANLVAPCPHSNQCPLEKTDWCHFFARIERTSSHRKIKVAALNYEDEKFSYMIFSRKKVRPCDARIIRHPFKGSGFVKLKLCSTQGIEEKTITKTNKQQYSHCKKIEWGDSFI